MEKDHAQRGNIHYPSKRNRSRIRAHMKIFMWEEIPEKLPAEPAPTPGYSSKNREEHTGCGSGYSPGTAPEQEKNGICRL